MVEHKAYMEPTKKRITTMFAGEVIADSNNVLIMHETNHSPVYYFPFDDVRMDLLESTEQRTH